MQKNTAGQKWIVFAFNRTDNTPLTSDAANITANLRIDGAAANAVDDTNPTELEDGFYIFDITQTETNGDCILMTPASSTADIQVIGVPGVVWTTPANFAALGIASDGDLAKVNLLDGHTAQTADHTAGIADVPTVSEFNARTLVAASYFDPAADTVANVTTVATLTGHTVQTADHTAGIADIPTVSEFNARTILAAAYFDPAADTVANVTTVATLTGHTVQTADHTAGIAAIPTTMRGTDSAALASVCTESRLAELDAANLPTDLANVPTVAEFNARTLVAASYFDPAADAVANVTLVATTTTVTNATTVGTINDGAVDATVVADIFSTTALAETYAADAAAGTPTQILYLIQQALTEFLITGSSLVIKKLDGSTTAATITLNDATNPTGANRTG